MRPLRMAFVPLLALLLAVVGAAVGASPARAGERVHFTTAPTGFTPNGDGIEDTLETDVEADPDYSHYLKVTVENRMGGVVAVLFDRYTSESSVHLSWDGRTANGAPVPGGDYTLVAYYLHSEATEDSDRLPTQVIRPATLDEVLSPRPGARLVGATRLAVSGASPSVSFTLTGCDQAWGLNQLDDGSVHPQEVELTGCAAGPQTLTATPHAWDRFGHVHLGTAIKVPVEVAGDGPQLVLQPDLSPTDKIQTLLRFEDGQSEPVSFPLRCRGADPATFELRIEDADGATVRTFRDLRQPGADRCRTGALAYGGTWDGTDEQGRRVPEGTYTVQATVNDAGGESAGDHAEVEVRASAVPVRLTEPSVDATLGAATDLVWRTSAGVRVSTITASISRCYVPSGDGSSAQTPKLWSVTGTTIYGEFLPEIRLDGADLRSCEAGKQELSWTADWLDAAGGRHRYRSAVPVTIESPKPAELTQDIGGRDSLLIARDTPNSLTPVAWELRCRGAGWTYQGVSIRNAADDVVAQVSDGSPTPCSGPATSLTWDGRDDAGTLVPNGTYTAVATATDAYGHAATSAIAIEVDTRAPYTSSLRSGQTVGLDDTLTWTLRDGVGPLDRTFIFIRLEGPGPIPEAWDYSSQADEGGRFVVEGFQLACRAREVRMVVELQWFDRFGDLRHWREVTPVQCVIPDLSVTVSGTPTTDQVLTAQISGLAGHRASYQWQRDGNPIAGATGSTYPVTAGDVGHDVGVEIVQYIADRGTRIRTSAPVRVRAAALEPAAPTVRGSARVDQRLTAAPGTWRPGAVQLRYQWLRNGHAVAGATSSTYRLIQADRGARISVRVTGSRPGYVSAVRTSASTPQVR